MTGQMMNDTDTSSHQRGAQRWIQLWQSDSPDAQYGHESHKELNTKTDVLTDCRL